MLQAGEKGYRFMPTYAIDNGFFSVTNGVNRYSRPLYGPRGLFYVYAGDRAEWALSRPGKTGNLLLGVCRGRQRKWLIAADQTIARYRPGFYIHDVRDPLLGDGVLTIQSTAMPDREGLLLKITATELPAATELFWAFGGVREVEHCNPVDFDTCGYTSESHFFPKPEDSQGNRIALADESFVLTTPFPLGSCVQPAEHQATKKLHRKTFTGVTGTMTGAGAMEIISAKVMRPELPVTCRPGGAAPAVLGHLRLTPRKPAFLAVAMMRTATDTIDSTTLPRRFAAALRHHASVRNQIRVATPDADVNAIVPALCAAMDAVWDPPYIVHGGVHCHTPFLGWRHAYGATALGWWDRAASHFRAFAKTQHLKPPPGAESPKMDEASGLARQANGSLLHSAGFIWGHRDAPMYYNMQELFIDMLLRHLQVSGDRALLRELYPVIRRHLEWEKRCFDPDGDGLYENFANTHISDAHSYNGAGCAQASAYTFYAHREMARLAKLLGRSDRSFTVQATRIRDAMNRVLWMHDRGTYAECRDLLGLRRRNENPELPSIYHPIDSVVTDPFQAWQMIHYARHTFEHVHCGREDGLMVWSSNWVPWFWSSRQLMLNETSHLALAAWQAGDRDTAFRYLLGGVLNSMLESRCPGGCIATSPRDRHHSGLATDFACGTGIATRALIEGLFGIRPDALAGSLLLKPGFPEKWPFARIQTPYAEYAYRRTRNGFRYHGKLRAAARVTLELPYRFDQTPQVTVNGRPVRAVLKPDIGCPLLSIKLGRGTTFVCEVRNAGQPLIPPKHPAVVVPGIPAAWELHGASLLSVNDPQQCLAHHTPAGFTVAQTLGHHVFFCRLRRGRVSWWQPIEVEIRPRTELLRPLYCPHTDTVFAVRRDNLAATERAITTKLAATPVLPGTYPVNVTERTRNGSTRATADVSVWELPTRTPSDRFRTFDISASMNLDIEFLFQQEYRSPRSPYCSLQLPITGYGEWCSGSQRTPPTLSSLYFSRRVDTEKRFLTPQGVPFHSPHWKGQNAIIVSQWDNFPSQVIMPLPAVPAKRLYFLVAASANPMYSQMDVALIRVRCTDGSVLNLPLHSPRNLWPIWDDYDRDADAFCLPAVPPQRVLIGEKTWANLLDLDLAGRTACEVTFACLANETLVGLLGITAGI